LRYALQAAGSYELVETPAAWVALPSSEADLALQLERWPLLVDPVQLWRTGGGVFATKPDADGAWPGHPLRQLARLVEGWAALGSGIAYDPDGHALLARLPAPLARELRAALAGAGYVSAPSPLLPTNPRLT